jgi:GT2 family glycosyltransferase
MYAEEIELCYQIHHAGLKVMHLRDAEIIHFGGQSSQKCEDTFASVAMRDSVFRFFRRTRGNRVAVLYRVGILGSSICRLALLACAAPFRWYRRAGQAGNASADRSRRFKKWLAIARWSVKRGNTLPTGAPAMVESSPLQN